MIFDEDGPEAPLAPESCGGVRRGLFEHPALAFGGVGLAASFAPESPLAALLVALAWLTLLARATSARLACLGFVWFVVTGIRAEARRVEFEQARTEARDELGAPGRCAGTGSVVGSPTVRTERPLVDASAAAADREADGPVEARAALERVVVWTARIERLECEDRQLDGPLVVRLQGGPVELVRGDRVEVVADLGPVQLFRNRGLPDPTSGAARRGAVLSGRVLAADRVEAGTGVGALVDRARAHVRRRIEATYPPLVAPLGRALVLGESDLDEADAAAFSKSGLLHLLAVSGTHLVIAVLALERALRALLVRVGPLARRYDVGRASAFAAALLGLLYADFAGGSGSAWRAAFMLAAGLGARAVGLSVGGPAVLGASACVGLALDPTAGADLSFLLSALATLGLIGLARPLAARLTPRLEGNAPLRFVVESFVATVSATIPCAPVLAFLDGQMTWAALFANVVAGPLGELVALPACLLHAVSSAWPALERGLALVGGGALAGVRGLALFSAGIEWAQFAVPMPRGLGVAGAFVLVLTLVALGRALRDLRPHERLLARLVVGVLGVALGAAIDRPRSGELVVTMLDVGQGDALSVAFPNGRFAFVDGGGFPGGVPDTAERVLVPWARLHERSAIDLVVLSHAHPDHLLGLVGLARQFPIGELWHPAASAPFGAYAELIELVRTGGGRVLGPAELCAPSAHEPGAPLDPERFGGARVDVIAPCPSADGGGLNDESLVLRVEFGARSVLFTGDVEHAGEARLARLGAARLRSDVLKVAHHGSHTSSSSALLGLVAPRLALISSGVRNRFDHPRAVTLDRLAGFGIPTLRTDRQGSIRFATDGETFDVHTFSD